ncbi:Wzt carbohydrate-binding domain-containing protein [Romeria aff. gracilis LEGE 07310]|uniref:Wzt carbohydrate-binding domain-containing protein n=1 Tax=Vasconcelosia minhoensis LEGE 07310 TaxID=915328 RepID=A0A8J7DQQ4_9CYAN|nr:Wzt carbohydrate-binding domain-containing protein [Romeria aff. gracilis LEGE 07310]
MFQAQGVEILGLDGSYVEADTLQIPADCFRAFDLSQSVFLNQKFDLAISLEVAEHLPEESAQAFIETLVGLSDVVLFSAAIPHQGGTHHINEQWPSYWFGLFKAKGYIGLDILRDRVWDNPDVQPWYAQNSFLFVRSDRLSDYPDLPTSAQNDFLGKSVVHPTIYLQHCSHPSPDAQDEDTFQELTQAVCILGLTLHPNTQHPNTEIQSGDALTIEVAYQFQPSVGTAMLNLYLSDEAGNILLDTSVLLSAEMGNDPQPQHIQLQIERLDLVQGTYYINPSIFSTNWEQTYDLHWHRYPVVIKASAPQRGVLYPPMGWSCKVPEGKQL